MSLSSIHTDDLVEESVHLSGVLVRCMPERVVDVSAQINQLKGASVDSLSTDNALIVIIEELEDSMKLADQMHHIQLMSGVISASMIYHHSDKYLEPSSRSASEETVQ
ncbi:chaperone NapD [Echinimonas agarilytica]|uniref:Chaperone NapD n=1 Tax=Echinimonas agarilytica TaxID=1215918 RepID=A0AA41W6G6_9GAMM|nr:chaperone NapD [Echinimonas agarilytica]MCM2679730.1 chaperone NapD [Echinimonas agarilytica]